MVSTGNKNSITMDDQVYAILIHVTAMKLSKNQRIIV